MNAITGKEHSANDAGPTEGHWYIWDAVLLAAILAVGSLLDPFGIIEYVSGTRNNDYGFLGLALVFLYGLGPLALICMIVLLARMRTIWPKHISSSRRKLVAVEAFVGASLLIYLMLPFLLLPIRPPGYRIFMSGFTRYVETNADIESIRSWLDTLEPGVCTGTTIDLREAHGSGRANWPNTIAWSPAVTCLDPAYAVLSLDEARHPTIRLEWGGVFGHWGFVIGRAQMRTPASHFSEHGEHRLPLGPGVYVWHEIQ